jgi:hypothetical protein
MTPENENLENEEPAEDQPLEPQEVVEEVASEEAAANSDAPATEASDSDPEEAAPEASFSTLLTVIAAQAIGALGEGMPEQGGKPKVRIELARYHIDTLSVLQEKTQGHLTKEEEALLEQYLHQLRMLYVSIQQRGDAPAS